MLQSKKRIPHLLIAALIVALVVPLFHFSRVDADDRDLLRESAGRPYVFIVMDLSSSMNWKVGNELPTLRADDPDSKFYQAKEALYEVVKEIDDIQFGFGTFNQDALRLVSKHWLYTAQGGITLSSGRVYPAPGDEHVFGRTWDCDEYFLSNTLADKGCASNKPADLGDAWQARRMQLFPKLGAGGAESTTFYIRDPDDNKNYDVEFSKPLASTSIGDTVLTVQIKITGTSFNQTANIDFDLVQDFIAFEPGDTKETDEQVAGDHAGYFTGFTSGGSSETAIASDVIIDLRPQNSSCNGWDPNDDDNDDEYTNNSSLRWPTTGSGLTSEGDVLPWHWEAGRSNKVEILERLAPNRLLGEVNPDFGVARYFENTPTSGSLRPVAGLRAADARALVPFGETPLNGAVQDFRLWYKDWKGIASVNDPDWECRSRFLLILTDGNENCASSVEGQTTALFNAQGIRTFVVGFGVAASAEEDTLDQIADRGGTGEPFRPQNPQELVQALQEVFGRVREESAAFASAAVPSVQANVADKLYLTSFTPLNDTSFWDGHVDGYLKPLPLTDAGLPDRDKVCGPGDTFSCRAWDGGEQIVFQAPEETDIAPTPTMADPTPTRDPKLGTGKNQRRVYYSGMRFASPDTVPFPRIPFWADETSAFNTWNSLLIALGLVPQPTAPFSDPPPMTTTPLAFAAATDEGQEVLVEALKIKHETRDAKAADGTVIQIPVDYVLGDIFHSDPIVVGNPNNFFLFNEDPESNGNACDDPDLGDFNPGYRCFFQQQLNRRKILLFGSNDGQIHAFDAGILRERLNTTTNVVERTFDDGTGREVFSVLPRSTMPDVTALAQDLGHRFTVDGPLVTFDAFIDPEHAGTPTEADRRWRTLVIGGMREGGHSVIALDVTHPDVLTTGIDSDRTLANIPIPLTDGSAGPGAPPDYVPSCATGGANCEGVYPAIRWEFTDDSDEDTNTYPDLGYTWSIPNTGIIQVDEGGTVVRKYVAIFGGGIDPDLSTVGVVGNWLYMVDVETGKILYKRVLVGAAPSEVAAVDTDLDLLIDTIYLGTEDGHVYKVRIAANDPGTLDAVTGRITNASWAPFEIFDTGGREIYFPPSVFFVADLGRFGLSFGTGNRENLWETDGGLGGRYYVLVDNDFSSGMTPLTEASLTQVDVNGAAANANLLTSAGGWYFPLLVNERVIAKSLTVTGVTFFTTFLPEGGPVTTGGDDVCARFGTSRLFIVNTTNGNGFAPPPIDANDPCTGSRCTTVPKFVTNPFDELSTTKNVDGSGAGSNNGDELDDRLQLVLEAIKDILPDDCRFSAQSVLIKTIRSDTGVVTIAPVPICIVQHNWTDNG